MRHSWQGGCTLWRPLSSNRLRTGPVPRAERRSICGAGLRTSRCQAGAIVARSLPGSRTDAPSAPSSAPAFKIVKASRRTPSFTLSWMMAFYGIGHRPRSRRGQVSWWRSASYRGNYGSISVQDHLRSGILEREGQGSGSGARACKWGRCATGATNMQLPFRRTGRATARPWREYDRAVTRDSRIVVLLGPVAGVLSTLPLYVTPRMRAPGSYRW